MSHIVQVSLEINDLLALMTAAEMCGMTMKKKSSYRWWGYSVGDFPLPEGFTEKDLGKCDYALTVKDNPDAYEVGVVPRRDGKPGYALLFDFYNGGLGLVDKIGENASNLKREYALAVAAKEMRRNGFRVSRSVDQKTGKPKLTARRTR